MGYWWIIRSPILFAYLVRTTCIYLSSTSIFFVESFNSGMRKSQVWSGFAFNQGKDINKTALSLQTLG